MTRRRGFTLIELMVVILVIGTAAAVVAPRLGGLLPGVRLRGAARRLASDMRYLYGYAVARRQYVRLALDLNEGTYWAETFTPADPDHEDDRVLAFRLTTDFGLAEVRRSDDARDVEELESGLVTHRTLPPGVRFATASVAGGSPERGGRVYVEFTPWGYGDDAQVLLTLGDRRRLVRLHGLVGEAFMAGDEL